MMKTKAILEVVILSVYALVGVVFCVFSGVGIVKSWFSKPAEQA